MHANPCYTHFTKVGKNEGANLTALHVESRVYNTMEMGKEHTGFFSLPAY